MLLQARRIYRFIDLVVFVNYVYKWKIWRHIMTFLSRSIVVVAMFLLPMMEVRILSFERKMTVKELLNIVELLGQTIWVECSQF